MIEPAPSDAIPRISTGVPGLDEVLRGGLYAERLYLVEGTPGTGKTTLALQFLLAGVAAGRTCLYVTLSESEEELRAVALTHGWTLDGIAVFPLTSGEGLDPEAEQTVLHPSELELGETTRSVMARVADTRPDLVVFDSLSELRLLAQNPLRYRRQVLALRHFFSQHSCTVLLLDDRTPDDDDLQVHSLAHGVVTLEQHALDFGAERRRLRVLKLRGAQYDGGYHDFDIVPGGIRVFPRLVARDHLVQARPGLTGSGNAGLDRLLGGGLTPGTSLLLTGPAGIGKSTIAISAICATTARGDNAAVFLFDERLPTLRARSAALGLSLEPALGSGQLTLRQVDPAEMSPGQFAGLIRDAVEQHGARTIVIDSLNGYLQSMPEESHLLLQMHELLTYLNQRGVITILVLNQHGIIGTLRSSVDLSYLADAVMLLRYFEVNGSVRKAISVIKTRITAHERTVREFRLTPTGLELGPPLRGFSGVLSGIPVWNGSESDLLTDAPGDHGLEPAA